MHQRRHYIYPDLDTLAAAFVCVVKRFFAETKKLGRDVHIALSGGTTPLAVFRQLIHATQPEEWSHVHLYWGDERCVPASNSESNYGNAKRLFIDALNFPDERIHPINGEEDPGQESARYSQSLMDRLPVKNGFPVFDWIWLGLGEDGHTASIFPNQLHLWKSDQPCVVADHPVSGQKRISITGGVINGANRVAFLVSGKNKSIIMNEIVMKEGCYLEYPAFYVTPDSGHVEWYLDMDATSWM
jgi:6-phosphogluconolactonase